VGWRVRLAYRELGARRGRSLLALMAVTMSVGLIVTTSSISGLMQASVATPAPLLGRPADLWVSSAYDVDYDLPANLPARVERLPGVAAVQPVVRRPVRVLTPPSAVGAASRTDTLTLLGIEPDRYLAFHDLTLAAGSLPSVGAPGLVALAPWAFVRGLSLGQPVTLTLPAGDVALPIVGLVEVKSLAAAQQGLVIYAPRETIASLFGIGDAITLIEIGTQPGTSLHRIQAELQGALGPAYAVSVTSASGQSIELWQQMVLGALAFADGLTLAGAAGLIYAIWASSARSRRRQIGLLRAAGAGQGQVLSLLIAEAAIVGLAGSGLGLLLGAILSRIGARLVLAGSTTIPPPPLHAGSLVLAAALGLGASLTGALLPSIRAARQPPLAALQPVFWQPASDTGRLWLRQLLAPLGRLSPIARLAAANLGRERGQALLIAGTLALLLSMSLADVGVLSLLGTELSAGFSRLSGGDFVVLPTLSSISLRELAGQDTSDAPPLSPQMLQALERLGDQVWLMGGTTANVEQLQILPGQPTLLLSIEGYTHMGGYRFEEGNWAYALDRFRRGPAVLLAPVVARRLNVGLGEAVSLDTLHGPVDFVVAGIGDSEFTTCILSLSDGATYLGANEVNAVEIKLRPGADRATVRQALLDAVQTSGGTLLSLEQVTAQLRAVLNQIRSAIGLLIAITGLVAGFGVVNAMLSAVAERRGELGLVRAVGASRQQVGWLVLAEMAMLGGIAALVGTVVGWVLTAIFLHLGRTYLGLSSGGVTTAAAWLPLGIASVAGLALWPLLAVLSGLGAAWQAARLPVIEALRERGYS
jgi:putative ABC transport system permease protein